MGDSTPGNKRVELFLSCLYFVYIFTSFNPTKSQIAYKVLAACIKMKTRYLPTHIS